MGNETEELVQESFAVERARGVVHGLQPGDRQRPVPVAYRHQVETLLRLENGLRANPPVSGIVHLPTGAGKTRVAVELIARTLADDPSHRFLWATESTVLIQQTMDRLAEFGPSLPTDFRFGWHDGAKKFLEENDLHVTFLTRSGLTSELGWAHDARTAHPWRQRIQAAQPLTLIYDECHQLGAKKLQEELEKFYTKVVYAQSPLRTKWRVIGLSATPLPTSDKARNLLARTLFPVAEAPPSVERGWGMHVFFRVSNEELVREGVLCPVNMYFDRTGSFDIPPDLLRRVIGEAHIRPPGPNASRDDVIKYSLRFNKSVMGHPAVIRFFAEKLAKNLDTIGKTIVFVPSISVANELVRELNQFSNCVGKVAAVHSQMAALDSELPGELPRTPQKVLAEFKARGSNPCILVNVEMLTEGFDDPKVRTVFLAKLTLSTNRFWQMIGRGTRGLKAKGTSDCFVIDPVKLVRLYDYFGGYQPSVTSAPGGAIDDDPEEALDGALPPNVAVVARPPTPSEVPYQVSQELRQLHADVARAIDSFLAGNRLGEEEALQIAHAVRIASQDGGGVMAVPASGADATETGPMLLREMVVRMGVRMQADLAWLDRLLPSVTPDDVLRFFIRKLDAIERLGLRNEEDYSRAEMGGLLFRETQAPVVGGPPATEPPVPAVDPLLLDLIILSAAIGKADGEFSEADRDVAVRVVCRVLGTLDTPSLREQLVNAVPAPAAVSAAVAHLSGLADVSRRKAVMRGLVEIAATDGVIHEEEKNVLGSIADGLGISRDYVEALLDARAG